MPFHLFHFGIGSDGQNFIYTFGGRMGNSNQKVIFKYDHQFNTFTQISTLLPKTSKPSCADEKDGIIWVFVDNGRTLHTFDTATDTLTQMAITGMPSCKIF